MFVVISFGQILKSAALAIPKLFAVNIHGSLLPKYRGASPTNRAVVNGDRHSGVTVIRINERMDAGDMILRRDIEIEAEDTNITLTEKLSDAGAEILMEALDSIDKKKPVKFEKQNEADATYANKLKKSDGLIDWNAPAVNIHNKVRGLLPWPGAYTYFSKHTMKILKTEVLASSADKAEAGEVVDISKDKGIVVRTGAGDLAIKYLQLEGKKALDAAAFVRGHRIARGYRFRTE